MVDADGVRQAVLQGDLAGSHSLDSAWFERSKTVPGFANLFTRLPHLMLFAPGIVIRVGDEVVRAIGAPGAIPDDACAKAGLDKIRDQLK